MIRLLTALSLLLVLNLAQAGTTPADAIGPLAQAVFSDDDDDRPELFEPSAGDSDPSNFAPTEGDSDPSNFVPDDGDSNPDRFERT